MTANDINFVKNGLNSISNLCKKYITDYKKQELLAKFNKPYITDVEYTGWRFANKNDIIISVVLINTKYVKTPTDTPIRDLYEVGISIDNLAKLSNQ